MWRDDPQPAFTAAGLDGRHCQFRRHHQVRFISKIIFQDLFGTKIFFPSRVAVVAQWIRPRTLNREVPGSNLQAVAVVPLGKALYPHCLVPRKGLKTIGPPGCFSKIYFKYRSCCGSVDKTTDSQSWGPWFESAGSGSSALVQGTLSSLPSPSERT